MQHVALMGLGVMGSRMAMRLANAGFPLTAYNRTAGRALPLEQAGARITPSPGDAAEGADVVISMVTDDAASRAIWLGGNGALDRVKQGAILIECSTISPRWISELAEAAGRRGCALLDAPVTGSKAQAESGELLFLAGGDAEALEMARPVLATMARDVVHIGPSGSGGLLKLINNAYAGAQVAALAEAIALIERAGLDQEKALGVILGGALGSPLGKAMAARMSAKDYSVNFALGLMNKDMSYAVDEAVRNHVVMKTVAAAREVFQAASAQGLDAQDFSAVIEPLRETK